VSFRQFYCSDMFDNISLANWKRSTSIYFRYDAYTI